MNGWPRSERQRLPSPRGALGVWAEWVGREYGLFRAVASAEAMASVGDLAHASGYDAAALDAWLRLALAHGLLTRQPDGRYAPVARLLPPKGPTTGDADPWTGAPPPYRLWCDLALLIRLVPTEAAARWGGAPVQGYGGRTALSVLVARYYRAEVGPDAQALLPSAGAPHLYRELACVVPASGFGAGASVFPSLWVDSPDGLPIDVGWRYGFPKHPGTVDVEVQGRKLLAGAEASGETLLALEAWKSLPLPGQAVVAMSRLRAIFPASGLQAVLDFEWVESAWLLLARRVRSPWLDRLGLTGPWLPGLWLEGVRLCLSEPRTA